MKVGNNLFALLVFVCCLCMVTPAFAVDFEYGGFWRTRAYTMSGYTGDSKDESLDFGLVDSRGQLYTKHFVNPSLTWTNRIELNLIWGDEEKGGGIATRGMDIMVKETFVDLDTYIMGQDTRWRIGLQPYKVARGFLFTDQETFAGLNLSTPIGRGDLSLVWMKAFEGATLAGDYDKDINDLDVDFFGVVPTFNVFNDALRLTPYVFYLYSKDGREFSGTTGNSTLDVFYLGVDATYAFDAGEIWGGLIYQTGEAGVTFDDDIEYDVAAYLVYLGGEKTFNRFGLHGEAFYASGDDDLTDMDAKMFYVPRGTQYYWSEIMGGGVFDSYISNGSPGLAPTNIHAYNIGVHYDVTDLLTLHGDVWYAQYAETNQMLTEKPLGTELNLRATYQVNEHTQLDAVGAYLWPDDATTLDAEDPSDPYILGLRLRFVF